MQILFIHGRAQENFTQNELLAKWTAALKQSFDNAELPYPIGLRLNLPYYGRELITQREKYKKDLRDEKYQLRSPEEQHELEDDLDDLDKFQAELLKDFGENAGITDEEIQAEEKLEIQERGYQNWSATLILARLIDCHREGNDIANNKILKKTADVATYLIVPDAMKVINGIFTDALTKEPTIIIAHSLGTVIAYEILQKLKREEFDIRGLITLGSPLGVNAITRQFFARPSFPPALKGIWVNIYDKHDIVSLRPLVAPHFQVDPEIINHDIVNETEDRHGIEGYLSSHYVAAAISDIFSKQ